MNRFTLSLALALASAVVVPTANADCQGAYSGAACGGICPAVAAGTWTCNVTTDAYKAWIIRDTSGSSTTQYDAFGEDSTGAQFCCSVAPGTTVTAIILNGSDQDDNLRFNWAGGPYDLSPTPSTTITATINADAGDDNVTGSASASPNYSETLNGEANADTILGLGGDDAINGGTGEDAIIGGAGDDTIDAGADNDKVSGGDGDDIINGGTGNDNLCGNAHVGGDELDDGDSDAGVDNLWGNGAAADTCYCDAVGTTKIDNGGCTDPSGANCDDTLTSPPSCP